MRKLLNQGMLAILACCVAFMVPTDFAQEGHPCNGTWRGEISRGAQTSAVVIIMNYNGDTITGMINPGRNSYPFQKAEHDAPAWKITVTAENRQAEAISFSGVMSDIGARNRVIDGTWNQGGQEYSFHIARE